MTTLSTADDLRMIHRLPEVFTHDQLAALWELPPFVDEAYEPGKRSNAFYDAYENDLEDRAREVWACKKNYRNESGIPQKPCAACEGEGQVESGDDDDDSLYPCESCEGTGWEDLSDDEIEAILDDPIYEQARTELDNQLIGYWQSAIEAVLDRFSADYDLQYESVTVHYPRDRKTKRKAYDGLAFKLEPVTGKTWVDVCDRLIDTLNGYGYFWFEDAKALKDSYPYPTYKKAALDHLHIVKYHGTVYGGRSAESVYRDSLDGSMGYW